MATLQDILSGNFPAAQRYAEGYAQMPSYLQDPYLGLSTSQVGNVTKGLLSKTQFEKAQEIASKNAETLLGLPKGNTAMDRAKAMGFDVDNPMYHGTSKDIEKFDLRGKFRKGGAGYFVTDNPTTASYYAGSFNERFPKDNPNVMKLLINPKNTFDYTNPENLSKMGEQINKLSDAELVRYGYYYPPENWLDRISTGDWATLENKGMMKALKKSGFDSAKVKEGEQINTMLLNNKNLRSVNAAFDPARANEPDLLAATMAFPISGLLQEPKEKKKKK